MTGTGICFLDTEFTSFIEPELLSLGIVSHHGVEHYVELDMSSDVGLARKQSSSDFVLYGVLDYFQLFPSAITSPWEMGRRTGEWLLGYAESVGGRVMVAFDYAMDYELMEYAIRDSGLWERVREVVEPVNVGGLTGTTEGELAAEECYRELLKHKPPLHRHHALADAWALRHSFLTLKRTSLQFAQDAPASVGARQQGVLSEIDVVDGLLGVLERQRLRATQELPEGGSI